MDTMTMLRAAALLFVLAAAGGLVMAGIRLFGDRNPPVWLAYAHGLLAGAGLTLLAYPAVVRAGLPPMAIVSLALLLGAALGGTILNLVYHWRQLPLPRGLLYGHALLAVIGLALLVRVVI
jgi:hypothetical protein